MEEDDDDEEDRGVDEVLVAVTGRIRVIIITAATITTTVRKGREGETGRA